MKRPPTLLVMLAVALVAAAGAGAVLLRQSRDLDERITSVALQGGVHARVVLPAGYATSGKRYPVVYFLHGLPGNARSYRGNAWVIDALERAGPAILVIPQGARDNDTDPEYLNWGAGRDWETYVADEVPAYVDAHFRTIASRAGRALVGVSAGGYGATILGLHNLGRFSVIESWSGYFHPTDPTGTTPLARGAVTSAHSFVGKVGNLDVDEPTFLAFYVGNHDTRFLAENEQFDRELTRAHVAHTFDVYPGAHQTSLWRAHATYWLAMALRHLATPH
ncbi:MAG TPA: alpha/beta hydrolase-fold protein [Gaiellaceae bacterium]|nr:alpha/beta hydrolase-fold protein [Gaiellaceae bacterium]